MGIYPYLLPVRVKYRYLSVFTSGECGLWVSTRNHFFLFTAIGSEVWSPW